MNKRVKNSFADEMTEEIAIFREAFILERLAGTRDLSEKKTRRRMELLGIEMEAPEYLVVLFAPYLMNLKAELIDSTLANMARMIAHGYQEADVENVVVTDTYCNTIAVLAVKERDQLGIIDMITETLADAIITRFKLKMFVGMGRTVPLFSMIHKSKEMAQEALAYKFSLASNNIVRAQDVERIYNQSMVRYDDNVNRVLGCFHDGNIQLLKIRMEELIGVLVSSYQDPVGTLKNICIEMTAMIAQRVREMGIHMLGDKAETYKEILEMNTVDELNSWFLDVCEVLIKEICKKHTDKNSQMVELAIAYIDENLGEVGLSQQSVSDYVALSSTYFGKIFFQSTNTHVTEYINSKRVQKAKEMLIDTNEKVSSIGEKVGFASPNYFNNVFKNSTGVTPMKYRLMMRQ